LGLSSDINNKEKIKGGMQCNQNALPMEVTNPSVENHFMLGISFGVVCTRQVFAQSQEGQKKIEKASKTTSINNSSIATCSSYNSGFIH
jgi:hypothetical protein